MALGDDVEGLEERHARLEHRRELAGEKRDVFFGDFAAAPAPLLLDLDDLDPLPARISPRTVLPPRSCPTQVKLKSLI
jgi:hypothetical protein